MRVIMKKGSMKPLRVLVGALVTVIFMIALFPFVIKTFAALFFTSGASREATINNFERLVDTINSLEPGQHKDTAVYLDPDHFIVGWNDGQTAISRSKCSWNDRDEATRPPGCKGMCLTLCERGRGACNKPVLGKLEEITGFVNSDECEYTYLAQETTAYGEAKFTKILVRVERTGSGVSIRPLEETGNTAAAIAGGMIVTLADETRKAAEGIKAGDEIYVVCYDGGWHYTKGSVTENKKIEDINVMYVINKDDDEPIVLTSHTKILFKAEHYGGFQSSTSFFTSTAPNIEQSIMSTISMERISGWSFNRKIYSLNRISYLDPVYSLSVKVDDPECKGGKYYEAAYVLLGLA